MSADINENISSIVKITSRLEERAVILIQNQEDMKAQLNEVSSTCTDLKVRVGVMESKINGGKEETIKRMQEKQQQMEINITTLQQQAKNGEWWFGKFISIGLQAVLGITLAYTLWKLGLK